MTIKIGKLSIGKSCGGKWFPGTGYDHWDGWHYYLTRQKTKINLKFRTYSGGHPGWSIPPYKGFAIGPLMIWRESTPWPPNVR